MPNELIDNVACIAEKEPEVMLGIKRFNSLSQMEATGDSQVPTAPKQGAEFFHLIVENVRDYAIFAQDPDGLILSWNPGVGGSLVTIRTNSWAGMFPSFSLPMTLRTEGSMIRCEAAVKGRAKDRKWHVSARRFQILG